MREVVQENAAEIPWTLTDKIVNWWNPVKGLQRLRSRAMMAVAGGYTSAAVDRRSLKGWKTTRNSADADINPDLPILRDRSSDLVRNSPIACGAVRSTVTSVVGTGLSARPSVDAEALGMSVEQAKMLNKQLAREFALFANSPDCDITRTQNFFELQGLALGAALERGDCFTLLPFKAIPNLNRPYDLRIQVIESDRVSNPENKSDTALMRGGVEVDEGGAPVSYHITRTHPGDAGASKTIWDATPAFGKLTGRRNVLHHFVRIRPGQNRGVPFLAPVIEKIKQLDRYTDAEIMAAVVSGMFTVFVSTEGAGLDLDGGMGTETGAGKGDPDLKLGYGAVVDLKPSESVTFADPNRPNSNFDPFFIAIVRQIGMGLEIPYEILIRHFASSYSASRAAMIEAWKFYKSRREWLISSFCQPVYEAWLEEAVSLGRIDAPGFFDDPLIREAYSRVAWHGDAMPQLDPLKEITAAAKRIETTLSSHSREAANLNGSDWSEEHGILIQELAERRAGGTLNLGQPAAPAQDPNQDPSEDPENTEGQDMEDEEDIPPSEKPKKAQR